MIGDISEEGFVREQREQRERVLYAEEVFQIQGAIFDVNMQMGSGFLEAVYQECLAIEFEARGNSVFGELAANSQLQRPAVAPDLPGRFHLLR
jgi:PD-(D/E)XK nuclease superfamily protein